MATTAPSINVIVNAAEAMVIWQYPKVIKDCWGFAVYRRKKGETTAAAEPLISSVGFQGDKHAEWETEPTTIWPIQGYQWIDYTVRENDTVAYRVIPMKHTATGLVKDETNATAWSNWVTIKVDTTTAFTFNRGVVASQFMAKILKDQDGIKAKNKQLEDVIAMNDTKAVIRNILGGALLKLLYKFLDDVIAEKELQLYSSLYELNDPVIISKLNAIGKRANLILANGAFNADEPDPQAVNADKLKKINVTRRIVKGAHFAHHKYFVVTRKKGSAETPEKVWTGSTNITMSGLCTQTNDAVIFTDQQVATYYLAQWKVLLADCKNGKGTYGKPLLDFNDVKSYNKDKSVATWFTPVHDTVDLKDATTYIKAAKQGILFLMFKPGGLDKMTLYNEILKRVDDNILIHGVINADPGGKTNPTITFIHKNKPTKKFIMGAVPAHIKEKLEYWMIEPAQKSVTIHSKLIVIDPFSKNPVVITGSNNFGEKASKSNDDNLNIIKGNSAMSIGFALGLFGIYKHYRWRFYRGSAGEKKWNGLQKTDEWQSYYITGDGKKELKFWSS